MVGICRLCASLRKENILAIIDNEVCRKLRECCQLNISMEDSLPKSVCNECIKSLQSFYIFRKKVHESQESLTALFAPRLNDENCKNAKKTTTLESLSIALQQSVGANTRTEAEVRCISYEEKQSTTEEPYAIVDTENGPQDVEKEETVQQKVEELHHTAAKICEISDEKHLLNNKMSQAFENVKLEVDKCDGDDDDNENDEGDMFLIETFINKTSTEDNDGDDESEFQSTFAENIELEDGLSAEVMVEDTLLQVSITEEKDERFDEEHLDDAKELMISEKHYANWSMYPWHCHLCSFTGSSFLNLWEHSQIVHNVQTVEDMHFKCCDCQKICMRYYTFINHVRWRHHPELALCCDVCDNVCANSGQLAVHRGGKCASAADFPFLLVCKFCGKCFFNQNSVQIHTRAQHTEQHTLYDCEICGKQFKRSGALRSHTRIHSDTKEFTCEICGRAFRQKANLDTHLYSHITERPFECVTCKKNFKSSVNLEKHALVHSDVKQYKCDHCDRSFRTKDTKLSHERTHTGEMPYKCEYCQRRFRFRSTLMGHVNIHTGVRPYSCQQCDHHFTNWSNYNKHMKRRHSATGSKADKPQSNKVRRSKQKSSKKNNVPSPTTVSTFEMLEEGEEATVGVDEDETEVQVLFDDIDELATI